MAFEKMQFSVMLMGLEKLIQVAALKYSAIKDQLKKKDITVQIKLKDNTQGRYFIFKGGKVSSRRGTGTDADVSMVFRSLSVAIKLMRPPWDQLTRINAMKNFQLELEGPDELSSWFLELFSLLMELRKNLEMKDMNIQMKCMETEFDCFKKEMEAREFLS